MAAEWGNRPSLLHTPTRGATLLGIMILLAFVLVLPQILVAKIYTYTPVHPAEPHQTVLGAALTGELSLPDECEALGGETHGKLAGKRFPMWSYKKDLGYKAGEASYVVMPRELWVTLRTILVVNFRCVPIAAVVVLVLFVAMLFEKLPQTRFFLPAMVLVWCIGHVFLAMVDLSRDPVESFGMRVLHADEARAILDNPCGQTP